MSEIFPDHGLPKDRNGKVQKKKRPGGKLVATFDYLDADGATVYQACRYEEETRDGERKKTFIQRRPNGQGGWIYNMKDVTKIPYRLPELIAADESEPVLVVEGEKHVDKLHELGFVATCNVGGSNKWLKSHSHFLAGRDVIILPDNDSPGMKHALDVQEKSTGHAKSIKIIELEGLPKKGDVLDWFEQGHTAFELREMLHNASGTTADQLREKQRESIPKAPDGDETFFERQIVEALGLDVFGEVEGNKVKVFSEFHCKTEVIRDIDRISFASLLRLCGPAAKGIVFLGTEGEPPEGMYKVSEIKQAIAILAGFRRVSDESELGVGAWLGESSDGKGAILLVNAGEAAVCCDGQFERHTKPRFGDDILDLNSSDPWFDFDELRSHPVQDAQWRFDVVAEMERLFEQWAYHDDIVPAVLTGMVLATWMQTTWKWRPQVSIRGKSDSGKTTMFEMLAGNENGHGIFGSLAIKSSDSSAAGLRQCIGNTGRIIFCDEFESGKHRREILEMLKRAGRGDQALRGSAVQKHVTTHLQHIVWTAAIESGLSSESEKNRFVTIELVRPGEAQMGKLQVPPPKLLRELGSRMLSVAVHCQSEIAKRVAWLIAPENRPKGHHNRVIQSYALPAACYATAVGWDDSQAASALERFLGSYDMDLGGGDEEELLETIFRSIVIEGHGERTTIGKCIQRHAVSSESLDALSNIGIAVLKRENQQPQSPWIAGEERCLFIAHQAVSRHLLRGTDWDRKNINEILVRIEGAVSCRRNVGGSRPNGILLPMSQLKSSVGKEEAENEF